MLHFACYCDWSQAFVSVHTMYYIVIGNLTSSHIIDCFVIGSVTSGDAIIVSGFFILNITTVTGTEISNSGKIIHCIVTESRPYIHCIVIDSVTSGLLYL